jgi:hypothetical protein
MLLVPVMAQQGISGNGGVDILGQNGGIFETDGSAFRFPEFQDTNAGSVTVGNDKALAFGNAWQKSPATFATNNLEIKKNQDSGVCTCCSKVNIDQIKIGSRDAMAFGFASATNNDKIVTNQQ